MKTISRTLLLKVLSAMVLFCSSHFVFASWDPLQFVPESQSNVLNTEEFRNLKKRVIEHSRKGWCSEEEANLIMELILLTKPEVCVEIGTFKGSFFLPIVATLGHLKYGSSYAVNAWSNKKAIQGISSKDVNYQWWSTVDMLEAKNACISMIDEWSLNPYCKIIHATPQEAASQIPSIDFLHLLGGLSEEEVLLNAQLYLPKVKPKGYILLSNVFLYIDEKLTKMKALWALLDECDIVCEIENSNVILFRKIELKL